MKPRHSLWQDSLVTQINQSFLNYARKNKLEEKSVGTLLNYIPAILADSPHDRQTSLIKMIDEANRNFGFHSVGFCENLLFTLNKYSQDKSPLKIFLLQTYIHLYDWAKKNISDESACANFVRDVFSTIAQLNENSKTQKFRFCPFETDYADLLSSIGLLKKHFASNIALRNPLLFADFQHFFMTQILPPPIHKLAILEKEIYAWTKQRGWNEGDCKAFASLATQKIIALHLDLSEMLSAQQEELLKKTHIRNRQRQITSCWL